MKYLLTALLFFLSIQLFAQRNYQDVIYLKDGSQIRGMIIEQVPNKSLKIQSSGQNIFSYQLDEIEKITKEKAPAIFDPYEATEKSSFALHVETGTSIFLGDNRGLNTFSFSTLFGYRIKNVITAGLSAGVEVGKGKSIIVPVGIGLRGNILPRSRITPFVDFNGGYAYNNFVVQSFGFFGVEERTHGVFFAPAVGAKFWCTNKAALTLKGGYFGNLIPSSDGSVTLHSFQFKLGVEF